ncbi:MAG TPA: hypothetical protein VK808_13105 [Bacteroidia bacterium]|nr:hypothetical protein [Bacteroidia bacterium]
MIYKKLLFLFCLAIPFPVMAQTPPVKDSSEIPSKDITLLSITNEGVFSFGVGVGYSTIDLRLYGINLGGDGPGATSQTPAFNAYIDYGVGKKTCIGVGFTYQSVTGVPNYAPYGITEYLTRYNTGLRFIHYTSSNIASSFYYGARIGLSYWTDKFNTPSFNWDYTLNNPTQVDPSFQFFIGYRVFLSDNIDFNAEFGVGTPYLIEGGFSFRI